MGTPWDEPDEDEDDIAFYKDQLKLWQSLVDEEVDGTDDPFAHLPAKLQRWLLKEFEAEADQIDSVVKAEYDSWVDLFKVYVDHYEPLIQRQRIREVSRLVLQSQALPIRTDLLTRYQTALDNDLYKALKAIREAQAWRHAKAIISVTPGYPDGDGEGE